MSQVKSKWVTFGTKSIVKRKDVGGVFLRDDKLEIYVTDWGQVTIRKRDVSEDEWERVRDDYYKYKAEIDKVDE